MRLSSFPQPLVDRLTIAGRAATDDTAEEIRRNQARVTGRLAAGTRVLADFKLGSWSIYNTEVYADAVEHGANARVKASVRAGTKRSRSKKLGDMQGPLRNRATRKGPHMQGNHIVADHGPSFLEHMPRRLREASR
jgi:hypothetical protein